MATKKVTTQKPTNPMLGEVDAVSISNAAWSVSTLADLLNQSKDHAGFEGIESKHENAIRLAIQILGEHVGNVTNKYLDDLYEASA